MKKYLTEQPEKDKALKFSVNGNIYTGTFNGILFKDENKTHPDTNNSYSILRYDIEWEYT